MLKCFSHKSVFQRCHTKGRCIFPLPKLSPWQRLMKYVVTDKKRWGERNQSHFHIAQCNTMNYVAQKQFKSITNVTATTATAANETKLIVLIFEMTASAPLCLSRHSISLLRDISGNSIRGSWQCERVTSHLYHRPCQHQCWMDRPTHKARLPTGQSGELPSGPSQSTPLAPRSRVQPFILTFQNQQSGFHTQFTLWLVSCMGVRKEPGLEPNHQ